MKPVERYFHIRPNWDESNPYNDGFMPHGGATVRVVGDNETVSVQYALCSANDMFCRKTGREMALKHEARQIPLANLPAHLQAVSQMVTGRVLKLSHRKRKQHHLWDTDYSFATKYFQPKE